MHNLEEERIEKINKWLETVVEITSRTESLYVPGNPFTYFDNVTYNIVSYKDGTIKEDKMKPRIWSDNLMLVDSALNKLGFESTTFNLPTRRNQKVSYFYRGHNNSVFVYPNKFHESHLTLSIGFTDYIIYKVSNGWMTISDKSFDKVYDLESLLINIFTKQFPQNKSLERTLKILSIE